MQKQNNTGWNKKQPDPNHTKSKSKPLPSADASLASIAKSLKAIAKYTRADDKRRAAQNDFLKTLQDDDAFSKVVDEINREEQRRDVPGDKEAQKNADQEAVHEVFNLQRKK